MKTQPRPALIAIVGGSGSGKTWLAGKLSAALAPAACVISLDDFYLDLSHLSPGRRERVNFDHPRAIDWPRLEQILRDLRAGRATRLPCYDFATHTRLPATRLMRPRPVVIVEGLWLLRRPALRRLFARSIFIDCPAPLRLKRRLRRDTAARGRSPDSVRKQFREVVMPMHERFVAPQVRWAETVLSSPITGRDLRRLLGQLRRLKRD